jgi:hypothetical protein
MQTEVAFGKDTALLSFEPRDKARIRVLYPQALAHYHNDAPPCAVSQHFGNKTDGCG